MISPQFNADGNFPNTQWTLVARLHATDKAVSECALNDLCAQYHFPLYCFIRNRGFTHHDAQDALHDFLNKLLRLDSFKEMAQQKGRLRNFLSVALSHFLINCQRQEKRRSKTEISVHDERFKIDPELEERYLREASEGNDTPDLLFDRQWCEQLLQRVLAQLGAAYQAKNHSSIYITLRPVLLTGGSLRGHNAAQLAQELRVSEDALRTRLARLLQDYRRLLIQEVSQTVSRPEDVDDELAHFIRILSRP
jgi:DNA-directed RNA polymerase specialized sigma24 family protein